jgi:hypothetical protein
MKKVAVLLLCLLSAVSLANASYRIYEYNGWWSIENLNRKASYTTFVVTYTSLKDNRDIREEYKLDSRADTHICPTDDYTKPVVVSETQHQLGE